MKNASMMATCTARLFAAFAVAMIATAAAEDKAPSPLPFVRDFKPERYFGKWYEVARLPTPVQPAGTLAVAEYTAGKEAGRVTVKKYAKKAGFDVTKLQRAPWDKIPKAEQGGD